MSLSPVSTASGALQTLNKNFGLLNVVLSSLASGVKADLAPAAGIQVQADQSQIDSLTQASANTQDASNLVKTAQGGLDQIAGLIGDINKNAVAAANGTNSPEELAAYQTQINSDLAAIQNIAGTTQFNGKNLLDGSAGSGGAPLTFQTGSDPGQSVTASIAGAQPQQLGTGVVPGQSLAQVDVTTSQGATNAIDIASAALSQVTTQSAQLGALQSNTLTPVANSVTQQITALSSTVSQLRDTNYGSAAMQLAQTQILAQANLAVIAQANTSQTNALSLLG